MAPPRLTSINIKGFKPFRDFSAQFEPLEVFVGANGTGKTSLFELLRFLRDGAEYEIPPEIVKGAPGQEIFHVPGENKFLWEIGLNLEGENLNYSGELIGPKEGKTIRFERIVSPDYGKLYNRPINYLLRNAEGNIEVKEFREEKIVREHSLSVDKYNRLALSAMNAVDFKTCYYLAHYIRKWRFYSSFGIDYSRIRGSVLLEQDPLLGEKAENLSSVLHNLMVDYADVFDELQRHIRSVIPSFHRFKVKARGAPGEVIAFWTEEGMDNEFTLADISDGMLHFIIWATLCIHPKPPPLICIDEPEVGIHPRALPLLAGLLERASERTQIFIATHSSYFLTQFPVESITVMKKEDGQVIAKKPRDSAALMANLDDFGTQELELMHQNDELEVLS